MVDNIDVSEISNKENKVTLNASYHCPSCASGAEHYSELFNHGTCVNCGAPLEKFEATLTEKGESELKKSVVLLYSDKDTKELAREVTEEFKKNDIGIVDIHDLMNGSQTSVLSANLSYVMDTTAATIVIPSDHLKEDAVINTSLSDALMKRIERGKPVVVPVYTADSLKNERNVPFGLIDKAGINWDGKSELFAAKISKERALTQMQDLVIKNSSK